MGDVRGQRAERLVVSGNVLTITPSASGGPVSGYVLQRNGVDVGPAANGYVLVPADVGPNLTVCALGALARSPPSNTIPVKAETTRNAPRGGPMRGYAQRI